MNYTFILSCWGVCVCVCVYSIEATPVNPSECKAYPTVVLGYTIQLGTENANFQRLKRA